MKIFRIIVISCLILTGLSEFGSCQREENLWHYLESFRNSSQMPSAEEIKKRFGESNEYMEWEENTVYLQPNSRERYYRYQDADKQSKWLPVVAWRYWHSGDRNRWVDVVVRKADGTILGWSWFENVPPGEEKGPPD